MNIDQASNELFQELRTYREVVGTGVAVKRNVPYIVVYLEKASKAILSKIPPEFQGNQVKTEVAGRFFGF